MKTFAGTAAQFGNGRTHGGSQGSMRCGPQFKTAAKKKGRARAFSNLSHVKEKRRGHPDVEHVNVRKRIESGRLVGYR